MIDAREVIAICLDQQSAGAGYRLPEALARRVAFEDADSILQALERAGFVVVPRDPTEAMLEWAWEKTKHARTSERMAAECDDPQAAHNKKMVIRWRAMVAAAITPPSPSHREREPR